jgi:thiol-disulfide isomerase/thioredoxin
LKNIIILLVFVFSAPVVFANEVFRPAIYLNSMWWTYNNKQGNWWYYDNKTNQWSPTPRIQTTFWHGHWCHWCPKMYPIVDKLIVEGWPITYTDADDQDFKRFVNDWKIANVPTFITYNEDGTEHQRVVGITTYEILLKMLKDAQIKRGPPGIPPKHQEYKPNSRCPAGSCPNGSCPR